MSVVSVVCCQEEVLSFVSVMVAYAAITLTTLISTSTVEPYPQLYLGTDFGSLMRVPA